MWMRGSEMNAQTIGTISKFDQLFKLALTLYFFREYFEILD